MMRTFTAADDTRKARFQVTHELSRSELVSILCYEYANPNGLPELRQQEALGVVRRHLSLYGSSLHHGWRSICGGSDRQQAQLLSWAEATVSRLWGSQFGTPLIDLYTKGQLS